MKNLIVITLLTLTTFSIKAEINHKMSDTTLVINELIAYEVFSDQSNVYVNISTSDKNTMISILKLGLTVYFDVKGKKKKNVFVKYPLESNRSTVKQNNNSDKNSSILFKNLINDLSNEAEYSHFGDRQPFHILLNSLEILVSMEYNYDIQTLYYRIIIPKYRIDSNSKKDFTEMSIGIISGENSSLIRKTEGRKTSSGLSMNGSGRGRGSGGRRGGEGRSKGGVVNEESAQKSGRVQPIAISYWFDAQLND